MISLQATTDNLHKVITWNDATVPGICIAVALGAIAGMYYLFKVNQEQGKTHADRIERIYKEHTAEIKGFNELLIKLNNQYYDSIRNLVDFQKK